MYGRAFVLFFVIFCSSAISKPTEGDGQAENQVVNMNVNEEQGNTNPNQDSNAGAVDNKVADIPPVNQDNNSPVNQENNSPVNQETNPPVNQETNPLVNQENNPSANQERTSPPVQNNIQDSNQESNHVSNNEGTPAANDETNHQNEGQQVNDHEPAAVNEKSQEPVEQEKEEVDWGHDSSNVIDVKVDFSKLQLEQKEEEHRQTEQQQQEVATDKTGVTHEASESPQEGDTGGQPNAHQDIGVMEPEHMVHGDDAHGDHHGSPENATRIKEEEAERQQHGQERIDAEKHEMDVLEPKVMPSNVHDSLSRRVAEFVKDRQFMPDNAEEAIHGGQHVHEENEEGRPKQAQAGDVEDIVHGVEGVHAEHHQKEDKAPLTLDPDEMMHAGEGGAHPHDKHDNEPGVDTPNGTLESGSYKKRVREDHTEKNVVGPEVEPIVHEDGHVHEKTANQKPKHKVKYQDIIDLGLSEELLKGIDLTKLLEQEKKEMAAWNEREGINEEDENGTERNAIFWQKQVTELRKTYLAKLYAKVRHLSNPDLENAEWEGDQPKDDSVHEGENVVEHQMEMWASTVSKGNRKQYNVMQESWQKKEDAQKEVHEKQTAQKEDAHEERQVEENTEKVPVEAAEEALHGDQKGEELDKDIEKNAEQEGDDL